MSAAAPSRAEVLRAAIAGIMARGGASLGDKTLLDALAPATDSLEAIRDRGDAARRRVALPCPGAVAARRRPRLDLALLFRALDAKLGQQGVTLPKT